jgi:hypothetical protein
VAGPTFPPFKVTDFAADLEQDPPANSTHIMLQVKGLRKGYREAEWSALHPGQPIRKLLF